MSDENERHVALARRKLVGLCGIFERLIGKDAGVVSEGLMGIVSWQGLVRGARISPLSSVVK